MSKQAHDKTSKKETSRGDKNRTRSGVDAWVSGRHDRSARDSKPADARDRVHQDQSKKGEQTDKLSLAHRVKHRTAKDGPRGLEKLKQTLAESDTRSNVPAESKLDRFKVIVSQIDGARSDKSTNTATSDRAKSEPAKRLDKANTKSLQAAAREGRARDKQQDNRELRVHGTGYEGFPRNGDTLLLSQLKRLERAITPIDGTPLYGNDKLTLVITGSASRLGGEQANQALSERRVDHVANWFRERGFTGKIDRDPLGERESNEKDPKSDNPGDRVVHVSLDKGKTTGPQDTPLPPLKEVVEQLAGGLPEAPAKPTIKEQGQEFWKDLKTVDKIGKTVAPDLETRVILDLVGAMALLVKDHAAEFLRENKYKPELAGDYVPAFVSGILESAHAQPYYPPPSSRDSAMAQRGRSDAQRLWSELPPDYASKLSQIILRDEKAFGRELANQTRKRLGLIWAAR